MTVARSFKLSPATQNILENKKQQPRLFRDGNNSILICRHLQLNESSNAVHNNICFAASANKQRSLEHGIILPEALAEQLAETGRSLGIQMAEMAFLTAEEA